MPRSDRPRMAPSSWPRSIPFITEDLYDKGFVENWTIGFDKLAEHVKQFSPEWAEPITAAREHDQAKNES